MGRSTMTVIGGGCSGAIVAAHLLRTRDARVVLIEPGPRLGRGLAYGTDDSWHLLNSPASAMSARTGEPDDFVRWCGWQRLPGAPGGFLPRRAYGRYVEATLEDAAEAHPGRLEIVHQRALRIAGGVVELDNGRSVRSDWVGLALGHSRPAHPAGAPVGSPRYVPDPWAPGALGGISPGEPVVLLGTGLTAVDVALSLSRRGHYGGIHLLSRHGLMPRAHVVPAAVVDPMPPLPEGGHSLREILRMTRSAAEEAGDWRPVVDALRPRINQLWAWLSPEDRGRFLRHVMRYWEVHRHRMAPVVARAVERLLDSGDLTVTAGQLAGSTGEAVVLSDGRAIPARRVVNCTGPGAYPTSQLIRSLVTSGQARYDALGLGLDVDGAGMLVGRSGKASARLWAVGPLRRGRWWETTAVPEIRAQAAAL
ncbi:FAD/NAD(P)-binding protein [Longispora albida]|uniref:FAD/NAD(P)-binding protein n=1 Tax=Longispora albida TaxID=203523 RepID=UPI00036079D7|nr:FAD/NAD(P)-binding protein [Longispora albida]